MDAPPAAGEVEATRRVGGPEWFRRQDRIRPCSKTSSSAGSAYSSAHCPGHHRLWHRLHRHAGPALLLPPSRDGPGDGAALAGQQRRGACGARARQRQPGPPMIAGRRLRSAARGLAAQGGGPALVQVLPGLVRDGRRAADALGAEARTAAPARRAGPRRLPRRRAAHLTTISGPPVILYLTQPGRRKERFRTTLITTSWR